jgi:anti-sigma B factor antagonist
MKVGVRQSGEVIIVDLDAPLVSGVGDELLSDVMNELLSKEWKKILLNLSRVSKIDSCGIGEIVASVKLGERFGSAVKLINLSKQVRNVFDLTQILPMLEVHDSEKEALAAFAK